LQRFGGAEFFDVCTSAKRFACTCEDDGLNVIVLQSLLEVVQAFMAGLPIETIDGGVVKCKNGDIALDLVGGGHKREGEVKVKDEGMSCRRPKWSAFALKRVLES
jgi:hypothetical protein